MSDGAKERIQAALPAYEIGNELGRGAFGVVYDAMHTSLGRQVAIKQLPQSFAEDDDVRERFIAEAQMVASLEHPHIVPVYDFVEADGSRFLIMERCEQSVGDRFKTDGIVTDEACAAMLACLAALDFAHAKGLLHRDVKPENLMYDTKGVVKLADFGIARDLGRDTRRTATGMIVGTPAYMSPEQCRGDDLTSASDVYSVAMMGYELLTGALPFPHTDSINGLLAHHLVTAPTPLLQTRPELPGSVGEVIDRALAKDLSVRYSTAAEFAMALSRACVTAFGSGWLRRRRFVLHWPEIIAETERPDSNSPRTGTIMVRAGDLPHNIVAPAEAVAPLADSAAALGVEGNADAPTITPDQVVPAPPPETSAVPPTPATHVAPATQPLAAPPQSEPAAAANGTNWAVVGGIAAAVAAALVALIVLFGGSNDTSVTLDVDRNVETTETGDTAETSVPAVEPTAPPVATAAPAPEPTAPPAPTEVPVAAPTAIVNADGTVPSETRDEAGEDQPVVMGSNGNPILNFLPLEFDDSIADSPWSINPCPIEQPLVACSFAVISANEETGELDVPWFTLGFTPELEPAGHHIHFYIPELVDGDENQAGTAMPGGAWRDWDGPWTATSFNGDNGRTLYTLADFEQAGSTTLCAIVATADHQTIPGSGNCGPVAGITDDAIYANMVDRLQGQWVGNCAARVMAIAPTDWRWYDLNEQTPAEIAAIIRPTAVAETTAILTELQADGGVIWAQGPATAGFGTNFTLSVIPGEFGLNDSPVEVAETLGTLGVIDSRPDVREVQGRSLVFTSTTDGAISTGSYFAPDGGYVMQLTYTAPTGSGNNGLADRIAHTLQGC